MRKKVLGFTLIELMIVVAIIAIIAAIAIPGLIRARISANEGSTGGSLRNLATSQEQFRTGANVDLDQNGIGEYGVWNKWICYAWPIKWKSSGIRAFAVDVSAEPAATANTAGTYDNATTPAKPCPWNAAMDNTVPADLTVTSFTGIALGEGQKAFDTLAWTSAGG